MGNVRVVVIGSAATIISEMTNDVTTEIGADKLRVETIVDAGSVKVSTSSDRL